ncbi:hypothetical protein Glove_174g166 [Diversispora epigaea]|uniref:Uncharacterized protein n=1 Tax=Diversispora epigaea TaxID=1348612 RepID=A0A397INY3_9GLOM|nr:hypothetical protein Glove_174g166 [Diversispora epigaea]
MSADVAPAPPMSGLSFNTHSKDLFRLATIVYQKQKEVSPTYVADILNKATSLLNQITFTYSYIDKPQEGQLYLISLSPNVEELPSDGYQYLDQEITLRSTLGNGRELLCMVRKQGFTPGEPITSKVRHRYRFAIGHHDLQLLHYSSLDETQRQRVNSINSDNRQMTNPSYNAHMTPRRYPISPMQNIGPYARPTGMPLINSVQSPMHMPVQSSSVQRSPMSVAPIMGVNSYQFQTRTGGGINQRLSQQQLQQSISSTPTKQAGRRPKGGKGKAAMVATSASSYDDTEEPSGDELDQLKLKDVSMSRFKRNHEYIAEIFSAYNINSIIPPESPYKSKDIEKLKEELAENDTEINRMKQEHTEKMKRFDLESNLLTKGIQEIKKCTSLEEVAKIQEKTEKELEIAIVPHNPITIVQLRDTPDSDDEEEEERTMLQDEEMGREMGEGGLDIEDQSLDGVHEGEGLVGIGQEISNFDIENSLVTGADMNGNIDNDLQGYLNPVDVILTRDPNFVGSSPFANDNILSNDPTTYIGDPTLNVVNVNANAYTGESSEIVFEDFISTEDEVMNDQELMIREI